MFLYLSGEGRLFIMKELLSEIGNLQKCSYEVLYFLIDSYLLSKLVNSLFCVLNHKNQLLLYFY